MEQQLARVSRLLTLADPGEQTQTVIPVGRMDPCEERLCVLRAQVAASVGCLHNTVQDTRAGMRTAHAAGPYFSPLADGWFKPTSAVAQAAKAKAAAAMEADRRKREATAGEAQQRPEPSPACTSTRKFPTTTPDRMLHRSQGEAA